MPRDDEAQVNEIQDVIDTMEAGLKEAQANYGMNALPEWEEKREKDEIAPWNQRGWPEDDAPTLDLTQRELGLMRQCQQYANSEPAGLPGHSLMILVSKLADHVGFPA